MRSNIYALDRYEADCLEIPEMAEKTARYAGLDENSTLRLRLLAEELVGLMPHLYIYGNGSFWIESEQKSFELHLQVTPFDKDEFDPDEVIAVSKSGKNAAAKGIIGKISIAIDNMISDLSEKNIEQTYGGAWSMGLDDEQSIWSLSGYKNGFEPDEVRNNYRTEWDELEKSIIAILSDDVIVGVKRGRISIIIKKQFD